MKIEVLMPARIFTEVALKMALTKVAEDIASNPKKFTEGMDNLVRHMEPIRGCVAIEYIGAIEYKVTMR